MTPSRLAIGYALDVLLGDPEWFPHPVRWFGSLIHAGERCLRRFDRGPRAEILAGSALTGSVVSIGWALGRPRNAIWQVLLIWTALATRSLLTEAAAVIRALEGERSPPSRANASPASWAATLRILTKAKSRALS